MNYIKSSITLAQARRCTICSNWFSFRLKLNQVLFLDLVFLKTVLVASFSTDGQRSLDTSRLGGRGKDLAITDGIGPTRDRDS
jgi:hypothetical protein